MRLVRAHKTSVVYVDAYTAKEVSFKEAVTVSTVTGAVGSDESSSGTVNCGTDAITERKLKVGDKLDFCQAGEVPLLTSSHKSMHVVIRSREGIR